MMFSATLRSGRTEVSCVTIAIPCSSASTGLGNVIGSPSSRMLPAFGLIWPDSTPSSVDFPEPFSPSRPWMTPVFSATEKLAPRSA